MVSVSSSISTEVVIEISFSKTALKVTTSGVASVIAIVSSGDFERSTPFSFQQTKR